MGEAVRSNEWELISKSEQVASGARSGETQQTHVCVKPKEQGGTREGEGAPTP